MRHGFNNRRLQGSSGKRQAVMRSLVSSLIHHESIKTTFAKAKVAQQVAEKVITWGKRNTVATRQKAQGFLRSPHNENLATLDNARTKPNPIPLGYPNLDPLTDDPENFVAPKSIMPKVFVTLAQRYKTRHGGYTRIHKFGRRLGDNAPFAIVELVDGPKDVKFEMLARVVGTELVQSKLEKKAEGKGPINSEAYVQIPGGLQEWKKQLDKKTREKVTKTLQYRSAEDVAVFERKAREWADQVIAESKTETPKQLREDLSGMSTSEIRRIERPYTGSRPQAGQRLPNMPATSTGLGLARGLLGRNGIRRPTRLSPSAMARNHQLFLEAGSTEARPASAKDL